MYLQYASNQSINLYTYCPYIYGQDGKEYEEKKIDLKKGMLHDLNKGMLHLRVNCITEGSPPGQGKPCKIMENYVFKKLSCQMYLDK